MDSSAGLETGHMHISKAFSGNQWEDSVSLKVSSKSWWDNGGLGRRVYLDRAASKFHPILSRKCKVSIPKASAGERSCARNCRAVHVSLAMRQAQRTGSDSHWESQCSLWWLSRGLCLGEEGRECAPLWWAKVVLLLGPIIDPTLGVGILAWGHFWMKSCLRGRMPGQEGIPTFLETELRGFRWSQQREGLGWFKRIWVRGLERKSWESTEVSRK